MGMASSTICETKGFEWGWTRELSHETDRYAHRKTRIMLLNC